MENFISFIEEHPYFILLLLAVAYGVARSLLELIVKFFSILPKFVLALTALLKNDPEKIGFGDLRIAMRGKNANEEKPQLDDILSDPKAKVAKIYQFSDISKQGTRKDERKRGSTEVKSQR